MIKSMTGFGKAEVAIPDKKITVEIRTLNSKQLDLAVKLPSAYRPLEYEIRALAAMALGALQSIQQAGRTVGKDVYLVGVDALVEAVQNVVDGNMTGTVLNDDVGQATKAAEATKLFVEGKDVEKYYWVDYVKVTKDNASQYLK